MISDKKFQAIQMIVCDIDGVLTDCRVGYGASDFIKFFHYRDGHWIKLAQRAGLKIGFLSGRASLANKIRANELGVDFCREDEKDKLVGFEAILAEYGLAPENCLYIGDDLIDMPVMRRAGIAVAVADGVPELDEVADFRTELPGGHGAVAEVIRKLLIEQGKLDQVIEKYRR